MSSSQRINSGRPQWEATELNSEHQHSKDTMRLVMPSDGCSLLHSGERLNLKFERLGILPLDLHFRLKFLDEKVEPCDFRA